MGLLEEKMVEKAYDDTRPLGADFWHEKSEKERARLMAFATALKGPAK